MSSMMMTRAISSFLLVLGLAVMAAAQARAAACAPMRHDGLKYTVCAVDPTSERLQLFRTAADGSVLGSFHRVELFLAPQGQRLALAMNAGMYHRDRSPVGLYVENDTQEQRLITNPGPGNFGLLPNGVFCFGQGSARVLETLSFERQAPRCRYATQSGPMLVIDGALHPKFLPDSTSRHIRNGVGVDAEGHVFLAISDQPVTFHEFGRLFRDALNTPNALYFDGKVSRLFARDLDRNDAGLPLGPILGVVEPLPR